MRRFRAILWGLLLIVSIGAMGCGNSDDSFIGGFQRIITSLTVSPKPVTKALGQTQQFAATATSNDGTTADVTGLVTWSSSNPAVVSVTASGLATALLPGNAVITASGAGLSDGATFTVSTPVGPAANMVAINAAGSGLLRFNSLTPNVTTSVAVVGLVAGDTLVGIDVRPQNRFLYGLGFNSEFGTVNLYSINPDNGQANVVGSTGTFFTGDGLTPVPIAGTGFGFDFNPSADRIRVVTNAGQNFRINPNTGAFIDGNLGGAIQPGLNMDGSINGATTTADAAAYTNNQPNTTITTLYTLDGTSNSLYLQVPPNAGTETGAQVITLGGATLDFTSVNGFDILPGVNAAASDTAVASGSALAALNVGGTTNLYAINLVNGQASLLGTNGNNLNGLTALIEAPGQAIVGLTDAGSVLRFNSTTPGTTTTVATSGVPAGETLVGIDYRPNTGQLFGLGINATANTGTLYLIDPQNGAATTVGIAGSIAFVDGAANPIDFPDPATTGYGFDFNPTVDRVRVTTGTGLNFRLNPITGASVDGDAGTAGTNPDGNINGSGVTGVTGAGYTNSFAGATVTTLYTLDSTTDQLLIQNPPNNGTQTTPLALGVNFSSTGGFDIPRTVTVAASNAAATGSATASLTVGGVTGLYTINLATGAATLSGTIGAGATPLAGLTISN